MKKLSSLTLIWIFCFQIAYAGIGGSAVWELNAGASNASTQQGCAFDPGVAVPGTDYSQQMTAQISFTDIWTDTVSASVIHSTANQFTSLHPGNFIKMTAGTGFITGATSWYEIVSVADNMATLDRDIADRAGRQNGSGLLGGACSMNSTLDDELFETFQSSNTVWVHSGNFTVGEAVTVVNDATDFQPINIIGYRATRGDNPAIGTQPVINSGANTLSLTGANNYSFRNIEVTGTGQPTMSMGTGGIFAYGKMSNTSASALRPVLNAGLGTYNSAFTSPAGVGLVANINGGIFYGNIVYNSSICFQNSSFLSSMVVSNNIFSFCNSTGITMSQGTTASLNKFVNNTIYCSSQTSSVGVYANGAGNVRNFFVNNTVSNCATAVKLDNEIGSNIFDNNNYFGNTINFSSGASNGQMNNTFLDPQFINVTSWQLANFSVGGNMKGQGTPSFFANFASTGSIDMGAVQRVEPDPVILETQKIFQNGIFRNGTLR